MGITIDVLQTNRRDNDSIKLKSIKHNIIQSDFFNYNEIVQT